MTDGLGPAAAQKVARYLHDRRLAANDLLALSIEDVTRDIGLSERIAGALREQLAHPLSLVDVPEGVELLLPGDEHFPNDLFTEANPPLAPVLWAMSNSSLLAHASQSIAVAGSRDCPESTAQLAYEIGRIASGAGWIVVSGLAQGVDRAAHEGAIAGGSGTIGVLASGLMHAGRSSIPEFVDDVCIVSQFMPTEPWSGPRAMQRNSTIASLASRVIIIAAGVSGGSWEMGQLCLKRSKPLYVLDLDADVAPGNRRLIKSGARPVDPDNLFACLAPEDGQGSLFG